MSTASFVVPESCERWSVIELSFPGKTDGNPFIDYDITAEFKGPDETRTVHGFYDGDGVYRVRFMPSQEGTYTYTVSGSFSDDATQGTFEVTPASKGNHGPVHVRNTYHFGYEDGKPYYPIGTTCYAFVLEKPELVEETFNELGKGYFNKLRFCILPKHYDFCLHDPVCFPFEGTPMDNSVLTSENVFTYWGGGPGNDWDFQKLNPEFFQLYDRAIARLMDMGIEADIILLHPYDRWGFSKMSMEDNLRYLRYVTARYGAYRNVWWSMANEFDLMGHLTIEDWETMAAAVKENDPYGHPISIHNNGEFYDYTRPWITHASCQRIDMHQTTELTGDIRDRYQRPVVWDEAGYEGDIPHCWGNLTAEELVRRGWDAIVRGGYCGHSETLLNKDNILWWAHGGRLRGESAERFGFMLDFLKDVPGTGLKPAYLQDNVHFHWDDRIAIPEDPAYEGEYYFYYYSIWRPSSRQIWVDDETWFDVDVIDTWNMTITSAGRHRGRFHVQLPATPYMGIRLKRVHEAAASD